MIWRVGLDQPAARDRVGQHVTEQRHRLVVAQRDQLLQDGVAGAVPDMSAFCSTAYASSIPDLHDGLDRLALHLRVGDRRASTPARAALPGRRTRAAGRWRCGARSGSASCFSCSTDLAAGRAEAEQQLAQPPDGAVVLLDDERFGQRTDACAGRWSGTAVVAARRRRRRPCAGGRRSGARAGQLPVLRRSPRPRLAAPRGRLAPVSRTMASASCCAPSVARAFSRSRSRRRRCRAISRHWPGSSSTCSRSSSSCEVELP